MTPPIPVNFQFDQNGFVCYLITKKHGSVDRYYLRFPDLTSDRLITKEEVLKLLVKAIPSVSANIPQEIKEKIEEMTNPAIAEEEDFFGEVELDEVEYTEDDSTVSAEDIEDIGDTVVLAHIPMQQQTTIDVQSSVVQKISDKDWNPTIDTLTVKDLEALGLLKQENHSLKVQNQDLITQLADLQSAQDQISEDLALSEKVNSEMRSQLSTYREKLMISQKELEELEKTVEPLIEGFQKAKEHSSKMTEFVGLQDQKLNEMEDIIADLKLKQNQRSD